MHITVTILFKEVFDGINTFQSLKDIYDVKLIESINETQWPQQLCGQNGQSKRLFSTLCKVF